MSIKQVNPQEKGLPFDEVSHLYGAVIIHACGRQNTKDVLIPVPRTFECVTLHNKETKAADGRGAHQLILKIILDFQDKRNRKPL